MKDYIEQRVLDIEQYIIQSGATVRKTADVFKVSKSTVHKDVSERLEKIDLSVWEQVKEILDKNKAERHIRGGIATKMKYTG